MVFILAIAVPVAHRKRASTQQTNTFAIFGDTTPLDDGPAVSPANISVPVASPGVASVPSSQKPSVVPTASVSEGETNTPATYVPGHLTRSENGLLLSEGLKSRILAQSGQRVPYGTGGQSSINFHGLPDFGAIYKDERPGNEGGWIYVSNSEVRLIKNKGGVGALTFDKHGNVMDYKMVLEGTTANCAGGKTPWNAWVSCEEHPSGLNWQVDPTGVREARPITLGMDGGLFETFAYDVRDRNEPHFFVTEDHFEGALRRFTPDSANWSDPWNILYGPGETEFLTLTPDSSGTAGQYGWTKNHETGKANAALHFQNAEGMDVYENELYFISKRFKSLFMLDLDTGTYTNQTTRHGLFDGGPDQLQRIVGDENELLYFTEDGGRDAGIHARNVKGQYFTILESPVYIDETSGLDFSPDATRMYVAYQKSGLLFEIRREDGLPFHGKTLNVKYHATSN
ncbi:predicted protein [Phaeodactylum tricornutum CCAP 1055/1]|uniref:DUF839 domain-containing protein n=1 Tax=Phaeodactylum tricornutum (strain CCAP 1055/1) TaxID=556484 RepID=B7FVE0_PHATC|nr:predicted protein [Phaeodactylum tricornutum CCAP 1055/1]EEC49612.1 predicted protein [Phaeodactylum tricornutum CCAP 1055/1]|eukprot:XP_002178914.1 predicted protein [Phaeodactylum tricornutum CCAP 1055/1]